LNFENDDFDDGLPANRRGEEINAALRIAEKRVTFASEQLAFRNDADHHPIFPGEQPAPITIKNQNPRAKSRSNSKDRSRSGSKHRISERTERSKSPKQRSSGKGSAGRKQKKAVVHPPSHHF